MKPTSGKINDSLSESNGENQQQKPKKKKLSTQLPQPGTAQGSCAFDSAMITLVPITDAAHVVHGPSGCAASIWGSYSSLSSDSMLYKSLDYGQFSKVGYLGTMQLLFDIGNLFLEQSAKVKH
ncbi:hypothetical protein JYQ62_25680 [Nostoc sp. UHCC 0702]|nr:hypothetical protein JYQ62_25680 [Nostoc sp. UHCC 0702]